MGHGGNELSGVVVVVAIGGVVGGVVGGSVSPGAAVTGVVELVDVVAAGASLPAWRIEPLLLQAASTTHAASATARRLIP